ncbi:hypothetical protein HY486_00920 [Candidatus Woesearchaeota archaeon]|nr:hypothetical protein [Candidatus Woesearchaeota archaeon]
MDHRRTHPFADSYRVCIGGYDFDKIDKLAPGEAIAKLLVDAKRIILSGYGGKGLHPIIGLKYLPNHRISLSKVQRMRLPVTNVNYVGWWHDEECRRWDDYEE